MSLRSKAPLFALALVPLLALGAAVFFERAQRDLGPELNGTGIRLAIIPRGHGPDDGHDSKDERWLLTKDGRGETPCVDNPVVYADRELPLDVLRKRLAACPNVKTLIFGYEDERSDRHWITTRPVAFFDSKLTVDSMGGGRLLINGQEASVPIASKKELHEHHVHYAFRSADTIEGALAIISSVETQLLVPDKTLRERSVKLAPIYAPPGYGNTKHGCKALMRRDDWPSARARLVEDCRSGGTSGETYDVLGLHVIGRLGFVHEFYDATTDELVGYEADGECIGLVPAAPTDRTSASRCLNHELRPMVQQTMPKRRCDCIPADPLCSCL